MAPRGKDSEPPSRTVAISKKLSWLLRHGAESENLALGPGGFANLANVLNNRKLRGMQITFDEVRRVVDENEKQRFSLLPASASYVNSETTNGTNEESSNDIDRTAELQQPTIDSKDPKHWKIRANQGHSLKIVEDEGLLEPITLADADKIPETAVHGTTHSAWPSIVASGGLKTMGRNHVHFAAGLPAGFTSLASAEGDAIEAPVISGMRSTSTILVYLDLRKALEAGLKFARSQNGVILTEGNEEGLVPSSFFRRVEDRTGEGVLVEDGKLVKEAPAKWSKGGPRGGRGRGQGRGKG